MKQRRWMLLLLLVPVLEILTAGNRFIYSAGSQFSDLTISHWPNAYFIHQSIMLDRQVPLWSSAILSGYPLIANPLSGLHYPPGWFSILWPEPVVFNLLTAAHLIWMGLGCFVFLRRNGVSMVAALTGAVMLESLPKIQSHFFAGHISLVYALSWLPWLLLLEKERNAPDRQTHLVPAGLVWGVMILADPRVAIYGGLLWVAYSLKLLFGDGAGLRHVVKQSPRWALRFGGQSLLGLMLAAPLLLPLWEYASLSPRGVMSAVERSVLALHPVEWIGLIVPVYGQNAEKMLYSGAMTWVLIGIALSVPLIRRQNAFWLGTAAVCMLLSMGSSIPGIDWLLSLPGLSLLRVPSRFWLISGFALSIVVAQCLDWLLTAPIPKRAPLAAAGVGTAGLMINLVVGGMSGWRPETYQGAIACLLGTIVIAALPRLIKNTDRAGWLVLALIVLDTGLVNVRSQQRIAGENVRQIPDALITALQTIEKPFRIYSPSYSLSQPGAAWNDLEQADGIDPLQLRSTVVFMENASGVPGQGYSVTLPPFSSGNLEADNQPYQPDANLLGLLNVRLVVSAFELHAPGLTLLSTDQNVQVYSNDLARPRAWVSERKDSTDATAVRPVKTQRLTANQIDLQAQGPGWLILSEVDYPGWRVFVDGEEKEITPAFSLLRSVPLEDGTHHVVFGFVPVLFYAGLALSCATLIGVVGWRVAGLKRNGSRVKKS